MLNWDGPDGETKSERYKIIKLLMPYSTFENL